MTSQEYISIFFLIMLFGAAGTGLFIYFNPPNDLTWCMIFKPRYNISHKTGLFIGDHPPEARDHRCFEAPVWEEYCKVSHPDQCPEPKKHYPIWYGMDTVTPIRPMPVLLDHYRFDSQCGWLFPAGEHFRKHYDRPNCDWMKFDGDPLWMHVSIMLERERSGGD